MNITTLIVIVTTLISIAGFNSRPLFNALKHHPWSESRKSQYYRWLSSGFLHGSWLHLIINMLVFYMFGRNVEDRFLEEFGAATGGLYFVSLYLLTIILADLPTYFKHRNQPSFASVGASGGVSGILFIFILFEPWDMMYLYGLIPIPGVIAGIAFLIYSSWASRKGSDMIDHDAHFYGALVGFFGTVLLKPSLLTDFINELTNVPF